MSDGRFKLGQLKGRWVSVCYEDGKRHRTFLFSDDQKSPRTRQQALDALAALERQTKATLTPTVGKLWEMYRAEKKGRRVAVAMEFEWRKMAPFWAHVMPDEITTEKCLEWTAKRRAAGKHDGTIWTELGHLRSVMTWARDAKLISYAPKIERPPKPAPKDRALTRSELVRLVDAAKAPHIRLAIILLICTGARVGAVLDLTWSRVDFARRQIRLRLDDTLQRKGRATVPINDWLMAALTAAKAASIDGCEYVIEYNGNPVKSIKTGFNAAVAAAGLDDVTPHVIRHSVASLMAQDGVSMLDIAKFLGHEDSRITEKVYAKLSPDHLRRAAEVVNFASIKKVR